jgi:predicted transcriptional regulator
MLIHRQVYPDIPRSQTNNKNILKNILESMPASRAAAFDVVASLWFRYKNVYLRQDTLARRINNKCRATANRAIRDLVNSGVLIKINRGVKKTCLYQVASFITKDICKMLSKYLKSFNYFNVKFLCSRTIEALSPKKVTQVNSSFLVTSSYILVSPRISVDQNVVRGQKFSNSKGKVVNADDKVVMTPIVHDLTTKLGLTMHGSIKLRAFEDAALRHAIMKLNGARGIKSKFDFLVSEALEYSKAHRMGPNWKRYYFLRDAYNIAADDRKFVHDLRSLGEVGTGEIPLKGDSPSFIPKTSTSEYEPARDSEREHYAKLSNVWYENQQRKLHEAEEKRKEYWAQQDLLRQQQKTRDIVSQVADKLSTT